MGEITGDGRLHWRSTQDNSDFKAKSLENLKLIRLQLEASGNTAGLKAFDAAVAASGAKELAVRNKTIAAIDKQREATEKLASANAKTKNLDFAKTAPDTGALIDSAKGSSQSGVDSLLRVSKQSLKELQKETDNTTRAFKAGKISADEYATKMQKLFIASTEENTIIGKLTAAQNKESEASKKQTAQIDIQIGAIERLKKQILELQKSQNSAQATALPGLNKDLKSAQNELKRLKSLGVETGESLKKAFEKPTGQLGRLQYAQQAYGKMARDSMNPDIISKYNKKFQEAGEEINRLKNVGKSGFDELGNKIKSSSGTTQGFIGTLKGLLSTLGIVFSVQMIWNFLGALKDVAVAASGIDRAFSRLGSNAALETLRKQTGGFIADLDLERLTIKAKNFNIPIEKLGGLLYFAQQRAKETGEDVNKLTDNIIDGLGRKSSRIIDNLGISIIEIQKEFAKVGDFTTAVSNIIERQTQRSGVNVDTLADKTNKMAVAWDNAKKSVGGFFAKLFFPDAADNNKIGTLTETLSKNIGAYRKDSESLTDFQKNNSKARLKIIAAEEETALRMSAAYQAKVKERDDATSGKINPFRRTAINDKLNPQIKQLAEELIIRQNVIQALREQNVQQEKNERTANNILNLAEMEEQVAKKRNEAQNIIPGILGGTTEKRAKLLKEADDIQAQIDAITGKYKKRDEKRTQSLLDQQRTAAQTIGHAQEAELQRIEEIKDKYARKNLDTDNSELQAIKDEFDSQRFAIKQLNKEYDEYVRKFGQRAADKNGIKKVNAGVLDPIQAKAEADLVERQRIDAIKVSTQEQKQIFQQFEDYKSQYGVKEAKERFGADLKGYESYVKFIKTQIANVKDKNDPSSNLLRDYYEKELPKAEKDASARSYNLMMDNLHRILDATQTQLTAQKVIEEQYQKDILTMIFTYHGKDLEDRLKVLKRNHDYAILDTRTLAFEQSQIFIDAATNNVNLTIKELKAKIKLLKDELKANDALPDGDPSKLTPGQRAQIKAQIDAAKGVSVEGSKTVQNFEEIAKYADVAAQGFGQLASSLQEVNPGLADTIQSLSEIGGLVSSVANIAVSAFSGNIAGVISGVFSLVSGVIGYFSRGKKSAMESAKEIKRWNDQLITGQIEYNSLLREQARNLTDINNLSLKELDTRKQLLELQKQQATQDYNTLLRQIQSSGKQITGEHTEKYGGIFGIGKKTRVVQELADLANADYNTLLELYTKGKLTDATKTWFEELKKTHDELDNIGESAQSVLEQINQVATGTTASSIADAIIQGFKNGKRTAADFADDFKTLMQDAALSVFKSNYLNAKIADFYKMFSDASNAEGGLTPDRINALRDSYAAIITDANAKLTDLEKVVGSVSPLAGSDGAPLTNAIKGMTTDQADLLAGQFGGLRLTQRETNVLLGDLRNDNLLFAKQNLLLFIQIATNTGNTDVNTRTLDTRLNNIYTMLDTINKSVGSSSGSLAANGKTSP